MPKKQRNRDKNKIKKNQLESDKTLVKLTLDIFQEIIDQIELGECCKICYINDTPPLIRIRREGKEDIITQKFSIGKPYKEPAEANTKNEEYDLTHIEDENHPTLGDPDECGSYWIKCPNGGSNLDLSKEKLLMKQKLLQEMTISTCPDEGVTRELCQICKGHYAYGLNPRYVSGIDDEDSDSPHLPELEFDQPVIQFDMRQPNPTRKQLALIGASTWALLKRDMAIMCKCRQQFKEEIARETWECLTGYRKSRQEEVSLLNQLHPSNIVLPMSYLEPKSTASPTIEVRNNKRRANSQIIQQKQEDHP